MAIDLSGSRRARSTRRSRTSSTSSTNDTPARRLARRVLQGPVGRGRGRDPGGRGRRGDRRRPYDEGVSARPGARFGPMAIRAAHVTSGSPWSWSIQTEVAPFDVLTVVDAGDAPVVPGRPERSLRVIHEKVRRVARARSRSCWAATTRSRTSAAPSRSATRLDRRRALRRARRHGCRPVGVADRPRAADAPADRGWVAGPNFVQVGLAVLAGPRDVRLDAGAGLPLAHASRWRSAASRP